MSNFKSVLYTYFLPILAVFAVSYGYDAVSTSSKNQICDFRYALCTSAKCIPQPGNPEKAICFCEVQEGKSLSTIPCDSLRPATDENGIQTVFSTFSLNQFMQGKKTMKCPKGTPWTWCLNKKCTVDPSNPKQALCECDVMRTQEWLTLGGDCNVTTCETGYWSGAAIDDFEKDNAFMIESLGLSASPVKWCEGASK